MVEEDNLHKEMPPISHWLVTLGSTVCPPLKMLYKQTSFWSEDSLGAAPQADHFHGHEAGHSLVVHIHPRVQWNWVYYQPFYCLPQLCWGCLLVGGGGYHGDQYWSRTFPLAVKGKPIHVLEYWVLLISIRTWGPSWTETAVELFCDNTAVVDVCNKQKPSNPEMAKFLREFLLLVVKYKFIPIVKKISTSDNWVADFVSRSFDYSEHQAFFVANNLPAMTPITIPDYKFLFSASW